MSTRTRKRSRTRARTAPGPLHPASETKGKARPTPKRSAYRRRRRGLGGGTKLTIGVAIAVAGLGLIFALNGPGGGGGGAGEYAFQVGSPGPGEQAPAIELPSTDGGTFDLASMEGKDTLLFFQEGLMCQPCWDQLREIESEWGRFQRLGVDEVATITVDPLDGLTQKVADESLSTPVLSDPDLAVSRTYETNKYGMMGEGYNGHSFILVGPDGTIRWRADYGGAPDHTMYLPVSNLLADMRAGLKAAA